MVGRPRKYDNSPRVQTSVILPLTVKDIIDDYASKNGLSTNEALIHFVLSANQEAIDKILRVKDMVSELIEYKTTNEILLKENKELLNKINKLTSDNNRILRKFEAINKSPLNAGKGAGISEQDIKDIIDNQINNLRDRIKSISDKKTHSVKDRKQAILQIIEDKVKESYIKVILSKNKAIDDIIKMNIKNELIYMMPKLKNIIDEERVATKTVYKKEGDKWVKYEVPIEV